MDIKSPLRKYEEVTNLKSQKSNLKIKESIPKSIKMIMNSGIDYEFRTTIVKPLHQIEDFKEVGELIKGAKRHYLQNFAQSKHVLKDNNFEPFSEEEIEKAKNIMLPFVDELAIR
jgi:pyruvate formate lyase activating enzyme